MDYRVSWSPEAAEDIEEIAAYIEKDSPYYARVVLTRFLAVSQSLSQHPLRGRIVPKMNDPAYHESFIHSYRMIYRVEATRCCNAAS